MDGNIFERCLVWTICKMAEQMVPPKNDTELALEAFKDVEHPVNAWRSVRNGSGKGKFRSLTIEEAYNLAQAVNTSIDKLCWDVNNQIRNGWNLGQDVSKTKGVVGRPKNSITKVTKKMSKPVDALKKEKAASTRFLVDNDTH